MVPAGSAACAGWTFDLYSLRGGAPIAPPLGITYSYSPLLATIISPVVWLNDYFGWGDDMAYRLIGVPLLFGDVLAMHQMRRLVKKWRPGVDEGYLFAGIAISLFLTSFLLVTAFKGHVEGLLFFFLLLTLRFLPRNLLLGSLFAGLALATKHTSAILALMPVGLVLLAGVVTWGEKKGARKAHLPVVGGRNLLHGACETRSCSAVSAWGYWCCSCFPLSSEIAMPSSTRFLPCLKISSYSDLACPAGWIGYYTPP